MRWLRRFMADYPELAAVLAAAAIGLAVQRPLAWLAAHQAINILLAVLVLATAVTIEPTALRRLSGAWPWLVVSLAVGITMLPALSWAVARLVDSGPLRDGVMTVGLAPCEIACVAITGMAGGEVPLAAAILIGSTVTTVAAAGPVLALEAGTPGVDPVRIIASLALVVGLPLAAGLVLRARAPLPARAERASAVTATAAVAALVAVIASEVHLSASYLRVTLALVAFLAGSAVVGGVLGIRSGRPVAVAVLLTASMRDFAIAAGLAAAAFGPAAAAPLGIYGILVLAWGTGVAGTLRRRQATGQSAG